MRLKSIKLAGFKSFVDPTTVHLPSNLCAVVGPNGCGKSNIIDAVRWVMGESSAKNLRGENMTDVIFAGSSSRKPVGQAMVELVFDNSDHTVKGEFAAFNEISVKRTVNSEAQSTYYLNNTKCRRRDITDIFLGTGLGPRSYSIIEQGMVSRLIESKPEELRVFIEEAAGISKYKERRRETENRIRRTRENLERLTDIREELDRQLQHLQRQAKAAEKYKEYKQEERDTQAQLNAFRWRDLDTEVRRAQQAISELEVKLEAGIAKYRGFEAEIESRRESVSELQDEYQSVQAAFYSLGGEISKIEQNIEHQRQRQLQLSEELATVRHSLDNARREQQEDLDKIEELEQERLTLEPEVSAASEQQDLAVAEQEAADEAMQQWQQAWEEFNADSADATRQAEVEQQRIKHLENIVERGSSRRASLKDELATLADEPEAQSMSELGEEIEALEQEHQALEDRNEDLQKHIEQLRETLKTSNNELNQKRSERQSLLGRQSSLQALQQAALGKKEKGLINWLERNALASNPRLVDALTVESGWDQAIETVLGEHLQAVCVDSLDNVSAAVTDFSEGLLHLVDGAGTGTSSQASGGLAGRELAKKVSSEQNLNALLDGVYCADSLDEALSLRGQLSGRQSIVTRQGIWLGASWLRVAKGFDEKAGTIARQEELKTLEQDLAALDEGIETLSARIEEQEGELYSLEEEKDNYLEQLTALNSRASGLRAERHAAEVKAEQVSERRRRLEHEIGDLDKQIVQEQDNIAKARVALQSMLDKMAVDTEKRESLLLQRDELRVRLDSARQRASMDKESSHQLNLRQQTLVTQLESLKSTLDRVKTQVSKYESRHKQLEENLNSSYDPVPALKEELEEKLSSRQDIEARMTQAKSKVDEVEHDLRELENRRNETQENTQGIRDELANRRLRIEGATVKREALEQQLRQASYDLEAVLSTLPEELTAQTCEEQLERLASRIQRLGPINLAAIDEYTTQSERKVYLDAQNEDLEKALNTLQNAIKKIDKETRTRFKETFDKINAGLQDLFPKIFGGGHAYLDMVGEDLLDTGVAIMARPPGKKNSTIHLLSGGEKAMTAIALVFSIFHLNPSPFCMLDEVDAPLDDANISRYANLVKEMSSVIQFIFITHNRLTMESANQLLGVTMHEPGVSRLVSVDVDEAAELAAM